MKIDNYGFFHLNVVVTERADEEIRTRARDKNMTVTDYIIERAANARIPDSSKLKKIKIKYPPDYKQRAKEFVNALKEKEGSDNMNKPNGASKKTAQFHLRVTPETMAVIQEKAEKMSMSVSDYVTFVCTRYDLDEVSAKLDKVVELLEQYNNKECGQT